ncbi:phosphoesterase, MJ0936 family [Natronincola peptidivorans]|uniref:Phosphoesterase, MJ0936 family n=1 Tax=Natronincola peptidivorans TaxID=426128 RepID=A0A1I0EE51_9FIRM|nr:metallophosphoesterase family protein [Natronincola peptidivorans]SET42827.1 phosphoesterase, MJ0936 family [Natronincola peptidivorans]
MKIKLAVVSDIHGNRWALESVLKDIKSRGISNIINLGDSIYGPLDPAGTAEMLIKENIISISGNQDRNIIESLNKIDMHPTMNYVINSINSQTIEWLKSLNRTHILFDKFFSCHGKPKEDNQYLIESITEQGYFIKSPKELTDELYDISQEIILCGHSHIARIVHLENNKTVINPGSVGLPAYEDEFPYYHIMESGSPHARYCIISKEDLEFKIENIALAYDWNTAAECAARNNRNDWEKSMLTGGV